MNLKEQYNRIGGKQLINEANSYYDLKKQYYEISDSLIMGGIVKTLQDIKKKRDTDEFEKIGGIDRELRIFSDILKLFRKSKLGKII
tara:strand:+ start:550 stop:810 length:261 start_codon:yes stop_codon:yes gene_type:complete